MKTVTLIGLIAAGVIVGATANSYLSEKSSSSRSSATQEVTPSDNPEYSEKLPSMTSSSPYPAAQKSLATDGNIQPASNGDENLPNAESMNATTDADSSAVIEEQMLSIPKPEHIDKLDTNTPALSVMGDVGGLTWEPEQATDYKNLQIQLNGPDELQITRDFSSGEIASITESLPDGYYNWQAITTPSINPYIRQQMAAVRESGDAQAEQQLRQRLESEGHIPTREQAKNNTQSGGFRVANGALIDSALTEE